MNRTQKFLKNRNDSGLIEAINIFSNVEDIKFCYLTTEDIVRHSLVQKIVEAYKN